MAIAAPRRLLPLLAIAVAALAGPARGQTPAAAWPDTGFTRVAALALIEELRADLLEEPSATATLARWCGAHGIAAPARILAQRLHDAPEQPSAEQSARLQVAAGKPVGYRHVRLACGGVVLSDAQNWYVPARLTPEMNRVLDSSDTPFGTAVRALGFHRAILSSRLLWRPLPEDWVTRPLPEAGGVLAVPERVIENRAVLTRGADGLPFAEVVETYTAGVLAFPPPAAR